jgi:hypothetical protein
MDLSLLPHLRERALRQEAERRGVDVGGLDREQVIAAIRAHEARSLTQPLPPPPSEPPDALGPGEPEPIRTRSMARLLEKQGHLARARSIVRDLQRAEPLDDELSRWAERLARAEVAAFFEPGAPARAVRVSSTRGQRQVAWRTEDADLEGARALLGEEGVLTLRVVRVLAHHDGAVERRVDDRRPVEPYGSAWLDAPERARVVVAIGVTEGERFVAVAHARG